MKLILKRKLLVSLITILNIGFIFLLLEASEASKPYESLLEALLDIFIMILVFSFIYVAPFIIFIGVPVSIFIEKKLILTKNKFIESLVYHVITGLLIGFITITVLGLGEEFFKVSNLLNSLFLTVYPAVSFWIIDSLLLWSPYSSKKRGY